MPSLWSAPVTANGGGLGGPHGYVIVENEGQGDSIHFALYFVLDFFYWKGGDSLQKSFTTPVSPFLPLEMK